MQQAYYNEYSNYLNKNMEFKIYGHDGDVIIAFPAQNGRFWDYESFKMIDVMAPYIEAGKIRVLCVDSHDLPSFSDLNGDYNYRIDQQKAYVNYICNELIPSVKYKLNYQDRFFTFGVSMGAYHALNFILKRPDLFSTCICLSGLYNAGYFFPNYNNEKIYMNSPVDYLAGMPTDHYYLDMYRNCRFIICNGQGAWEDQGIKDCSILKAQFERLNVDVWIDMWGYDVNHDWPWWLIQMPYFLGKIYNI